MKKLLAFLLILVCFSSLTACKEDPLDNVNTDLNNSSTQEQEELQQIPIQSFDGVWKEINIPEERDITAVKWFQIVIENETIYVYWLEYGNQFDNSRKNWESVFCFQSPNVPANGIWKNPVEEVSEYSYETSFIVGNYLDKNGEIVDDVQKVTFTYKNGKLSMKRKSLGDLYDKFRDSDIIYFEKISD